MVLEGLGDSSNVGALFRNALAFGVGAVFLAPGTADPLYRKAIRVSSGATVAMPFARLGDWPRDLERLRAAGYTVLALTPREDAVDIAELGAGRPLPERLALLLGTEGRGLSADALAAADLQVRIPDGARDGLAQRGGRRRRRAPLAEPFVGRRQTCLASSSAQRV